MVEKIASSNSIGNSTVPVKEIEEWDVLTLENSAEGDRTQKL
jgi:hypothetical protein